MVGNPESGLRRLARRDFVFLALLLVAAIILLTLPHTHQLTLATAVRSTALRPVLRLHGALADLSSTRTSLQAVRAERDSLAARVLGLQGVREENLRLRALVGLAGRIEHGFRPANLYPAGRSGEAVQRSFVLDLGKAEDVAADAPVVAPEGLVGVVRVVEADQATGDFWTHPEFRVSAMTVDGRVFGIIKPVGEVPPAMQLYGTPYQVELEPGTELVTSGLGGVFPRGIPIGQVEKQEGTEAGWARSYRVRPAVYPDAVREVMVVVKGESEDVAEVWQPAASNERR